MAIFPISPIKIDFKCLNSVKVMRFSLRFLINCASRAPTYPFFRYICTRKLSVTSNN
nr:MAG TPA: hypothetical protein [Caudoviricetes sp.]